MVLLPSGFVVVIISGGRLGRPFCASMAQRRRRSDSFPVSSGMLEVQQRSSSRSNVATMPMLFALQMSMTFAISGLISLSYVFSLLILLVVRVA
jgi:hypothetical protein